MTVAAAKAVEKADLIIGAKRSLELFEKTKGEQIALTAKNLKDSIQRASDGFKSGKNVVFLSTGDPGFSGLLHTVLESGNFTIEDVQVVPGVSSIQSCAAELKLSWDHTRIFSFHDGNVSKEDKSRLVYAYEGGHTIMLLPASQGFTPKDIAALLLDAGADGATEVYVCENLTLENQKVTKTVLADVASQIFGSLCVMVIKQ